MDLREQLARNLTDESEAYGYTLSIWGGGSILINLYGTPTIVQIFLYIGGALVAFALLAIIAFPYLFAERKTAQSRQLIIASTIHIVATFGSLGLAYLITRVVTIPMIPPDGIFLFIGFQLTFTYNLFILVERTVARVIAIVGPNAESG